MSEATTMVHVGLPKGRFAPTATEVLKRLGVELDGRAVSGRTRSMSFHLLKARDIPNLVSSGYLSLGVASDEWITECVGTNIVRLGRLGWCKTSMCVIGPDGTNLDSGSDLRIATEFPVLTSSLSTARQWTSTIINVSGSTEAYVPLLADVAVDCVETGATLAANGLSVLETLYTSDMHVIARSGLPRRDEWVTLRPVLDALLDSAVGATKVGSAGGSV